EHAVGQRLGDLRREIRKVQTLQMPVDAHLRRAADGQVQVGPAHVEGRLEKIRHIQLIQRHEIVSRTTSSRVVTPSLTLTRPLCRSVTMPSAIASLRSSSTGAPSTTSCRSPSDIAMTSNKPTRPL